MCFPFLLRLIKFQALNKLYYDNSQLTTSMVELSKTYSIYLTKLIHTLVNRTILPGPRTEGEFFIPRLVVTLASAVVSP